MGFRDAGSSWSNFGMRMIERLAQRNPEAATASATTSQTMDKRDGKMRLYQHGCCNLAMSPIGTGACMDKCGSGGYTMRTWGCCSGDGQFYSCQECTAGSSCYNGPFKCSSFTRVPGGCA